MSKIEADSLQLFIVDDLNLNEIITNIVPTIQTLFGDKPVEIQFKFDDMIPVISEDKQRITQVLLNLASNACKFTANGSITIETKTQDDYVILSIIDTGSGIATENLGNIFKAFVQTDDGVRRGGGTGLGLPISKSLIQAHHGKFLVESELGKGSTFKVILPIQKQAVPA